MPILAVIKNILGITTEEERERQRQAKMIEATNLEAAKQESLAVKETLRAGQQGQRSPIARLRAEPLPEPQRAPMPEPRPTEPDSREPSQMTLVPANSNLQRPPTIQVPGMGPGGAVRPASPSRPNLSPAVAPEPVQQPRPQEPGPSFEPDYAADVRAMTEEINRKSEAANPELAAQEKPPVKRETVSEMLERAQKSINGKAILKQLEANLTRQQRESLRQRQISDDDFLLNDQS